MLPKLFPDVWGHLPSEEDIEKMKTPRISVDDLLKDTTVPEPFKGTIVAATEAYNKKDNDAFLAEMRKLFTAIQDQIQGLNRSKNSKNSNTSSLVATLLTSERDALTARLSEASDQAERTKLLNETHIEMLDSYIKELLAQKEDDSSELTRARAELEAAKEGKDVSEKQLRAEYDRQIATLNALNATNTSELERLRAALAAKDAEHAALEAARVESASALEAAKKEARDAHDAQVAALQAATDATKQALASATAALEAATKAKEDAQAAQAAQAAVSESEKAALEERLEQAEVAEVAALAAKEAAEKDAEAAREAQEAAEQDAQAAREAQEAAEQEAQAAREAQEAAEKVAEAEVKKARDALEAAQQEADKARAAVEAAQSKEGVTQTSIRQAEEAQAKAEESLRAAQEAHTSATEAAAEAAKNQIEDLQNQLDEAEQSKDTMYMEISEHLRKLMANLSKSVPALKLPFELQKTLNTHISENELEQEYNESLATLEQPNIVSFDEQVAIVQDYLTKLNDKYSNWESAFESGITEVPKEAPTVLPKEQKPFTQSDKEQIIKFLNVLIIKKKQGSDPIPMAEYTVNEYGTQVTKKRDNLGKDIIGRWSDAGVYDTIKVLLKKDKDESDIPYFNRVVPYISTLSLGKTSVDIARNRRLIVSLFKIAYLYIDTLVCSNNNFCAAHYIDAIYTLFNDIPGSKSRIMVELFGQNSSLVKQIFFIYVSYSLADVNEINFWKNPNPNPKLAAEGQTETKYAPSKTPTSFYSVDWTSKESLQYFINTMNKKVFIDNQREGPIEGATVGIPMSQDTLTKNLTTPELNATRVAKGGLRINPYELTPLLAEQKAWDKAAASYEMIPPHYKDLAPELDSAPVEELRKPFKRYIKENANPSMLEEAREAVGLMSPAEIEECFMGGPAFTRIVSLYMSAFQRVSNMNWLFPMILSDLVETLRSE